MGDLTDDITRLCVEIETLRDSRKVFGSQLDKETREMKTGVSKMREGFRKDQNDMAVRTKADRVEFVSGKVEARVPTRRGGNLSLLSIPVQCVIHYPIEDTEIETSELKSLIRDEYDRKCLMPFSDKTRSIIFRLPGFRRTNGNGSIDLTPHITI